MARPRQPIALTVAGSDSGGGAGIQADLKTFASLGVHGTSVVTCLTAQNPREVIGVEAYTPNMVRRQLTAVFDELPPAAVKTGMLYSASIIRVVVQWFQGKRRPPPLIVDPVMVATSGARLLQSAAIKELKHRLLPLAALVMPNADEAAILLGRRIDSVDALRCAAREIHEDYGCAALVKGGHLPASRQAVDFFYDGRTELLLEAPFIKGIRTHGTGCTYAAAVVSYRALGRPLPEAVERAKEYISLALARSVRVGRHTALNWQGNL